MRGSIRALFISLIVLLSCSLAYGADYAEHEAIVLMRDANTKSSVMSASAKSRSAAKVSALAKSVGATVRRSYPELTAGSGSSIALVSSPQKTADELIKELKGNPDVIGVAKNYKRKALDNTPDDPLWAEQWGPKRIKAPQVWDTFSTGSDEVYVAVLDTGVIYDHPDLAGNISGELPDGTYGKMFHNEVEVTDVVRGGTQSEDIKIYDLHEVNYAAAGDIDGHGTHVAGIIGAAGNNALGVAGVNWKVKILPVGIFTVTQDKYGFAAESYDSDAIAGLNYIVMLKKVYKLNIRVANMSLGGWNPPVDQDTNPYGQAVKLASDADIIICMAAGNEDQDIDNPAGADYKGQLSYPACYRFANTISVGASNENDGRGEASGSNYSSSGKWVDIMAPGDHIMSTVPRYRCYSQSENYNASEYDSWSGTSMATPVVAGAAALLCAVYPDKSANEINTMLLNGAENVLRKGYSKYGLLNVYNACLSTVAEAVVPSLPADAPRDIVALAPVLYSVDAKDEQAKEEAVTQIIEASGGALTSEDVVFNSGSGVVEASGKAVSAAAKAALTEKGVAGSVSDMTVLPVFSTEDGDITSAGSVAAFGFRLMGRALMAERPEDVKVLKIQGSDRGKFYEYTSEPKSFADGYFTVQDENGGIYNGNIDPDAVYVLVLFIKDNGGFDLDANECGILDPAALVKVESGSGGSSSGGCAAGAAVLALIALAPLAVWRRKR